jgi:hypothetical protein
MRACSGISFRAIRPIRTLHAFFPQCDFDGGTETLACESVFCAGRGNSAGASTGGDSGVEVRILLPMKPDHVFVWHASFAMLTELTHPNIHIHRFTGGFLHQ